MEGAPKYSPTSGSQFPTPPKFRRMKFGWRALLFCNFALGAYLFTLPKRNNSHEQKSSAVEEAPSIPNETTTQFYEEPVFSPPVSDSVGMQQQSTPKDQQQDLFGWLKRI